MGLCRSFDYALLGVPRGPLGWIDYPQFAAMGLRLDRTETLAHGGERCDFRVSRGKPVHVEPELPHA